MKEDHTDLLLAVIREAIEKVLKYPHSDVREREACLRFALVAMSTIEERRKEVA